MPMKATGAATEWREIDRFEGGGESDTGDGPQEGGVGWIAHPEEKMQRASHALGVDGEVWIVDPVDAEGIDDRIAEFGEVAGVVVLLDRHTRDADAVANRHDVPVYLHETLSGVAEELTAPTRLYHRELADTGYAAHPVVDNFAWSEVALYGEDTGTLVVPEALGTAGFFRTGGERLGVHPVLRVKPPRRLGRLSPERILVGHGEGILEDAEGALQEALDGARRQLPQLYWKNLKGIVSG